MTKEKNWILLDRDGVINEESKDYVFSTDVFHPIKTSIEAIVKLTKAGFRIVIITNQSGIGRGIFTLTALEEIHRKLQDLVECAGGKIWDIFFCPHHPNQHCLCRKPKPGLIYEFAKKYHVDLSTGQIPFVGDSYRDILAAKESGARPFLVKTGFGEKTVAKHAQELENIGVYPDLFSVATLLISEKNEVSA